MITHCEHSSHFVECVRLSVGHIYMHLCVFCGWVSLDCRLTLLVISLYLMLLTVSSRMFDYVWRITNVQWTFAGRNKKKKKNDLSRICNRWTINYRQHTQRFMWCNACGGVFCYLLSHILGFSCTRSIFFLSVFHFLFLGWFLFCVQHHRALSPGPSHHILRLRFPILWMLFRSQKLWMNSHAHSVYHTVFSRICLSAPRTRMPCIGAKAFYHPLAQAYPM